MCLLLLLLLLPMPPIGLAQHGALLLLLPACCRLAQCDVLLLLPTGPLWYEWLTSPGKHSRHSVDETRLICHKHTYDVLLLTLLEGLLLCQVHIVVLLHTANQTPYLNINTRASCSPSLLACQVHIAMLPGTPCCRNCGVAVLNVLITHTLFVLYLYHIHYCLLA
jgi:hypothetical protein